MTNSPQIESTIQVVPAKFVWAISERRCPCLCGGEGYLVFIACPGCRRLALACDEVGTIFGHVHDIANGLCGHWLGASGGFCPCCHEVLLTDFAYATLEEVVSAGFSRSQVIDIG